MCAPEETTASKETNKDSKAPVVVKNIKTDVVMGLKSFGLTGEAQAEKLRSEGFSDKAIADFQKRTEENKKNPVSAFPPDDGGSSNTTVKKEDDSADDESGTGATTTTTTATTERNRDIGGAGTTSVTAKSIYTRDPEDALSDQEKLAAAELRRQREQRALSKAERLRTRLESAQKFGPQGRRGGRGRRSLMTGSRGGIGYYSRFK